MSIAALEPTDGTLDAAELDIPGFPGLPPMLASGRIIAPRAPEKSEETGIDPHFLSDLTVKLANTVPHFTSEWAADKLRLPLQLVDDVCWQLKNDRLVEILGENGPFSYRYAATNRGREYAQQLLRICGYVGPAPVSLAAYRASLEWQIARRPPITSEQVRAALSELELTEEAVQVTELAVSSGRSLFLFGPPGNGKTSTARCVHDAIRGDLWIPHALQVDGNIIRVFDPQLHTVVRDAEGELGKLDRRWVRVRRPMVIAGGEMTLSELDLAFSPTLRFYEAPLHFKANGGTFVIDDFGRQRMEPFELLNRWIVPLEHHIDYLTLQTGQKLEVPFRLMLVVATNLRVSDIADPAFLRRMGYRLRLDSPSPERYARIFQRYAQKHGLAVPTGLVENILARYQAEGRELRASEPRDLIERCRDICRLQHRPDELTPELLNLAWVGYFGNMDG